MVDKIAPHRPSTRSAEKRDRIGEAVLAVLAEHGIGGLTHRRVAQAAGVPIAATTYHYATKADMLADAFQRLLDSYLHSFRRMADRHRRGEGDDRTLDDLVTRLAVNAAGRHRTRTLAWCELMLDAGRDPAGHALAQRWFADLERVWGEMASLLEGEHVPLGVSAAIDLTIGYLFVVLALGLSGDAVRALRQSVPIETLLPPGPASSVADGGAESPSTAKAAKAKSAILDSAIDLLVQSGPGAISYRTVAAGAGVALSAPAYYFGSIEQLIRIAEATLFDAAKERYRETVSILSKSVLTADDVADVTAAVLIREATEYRRASLAHYSIWLEAARGAALRPEVGDAIVDQAAGWHRRLRQLADRPGKSGMDFQALFVGRLVRSLASGASLDSLSNFRKEVRYLLGKTQDR